METPSGNPKYTPEPERASLPVVDASPKKRAAEREPVGWSPTAWRNGQGEK